MRYDPDRQRLVLQAGLVARAFAARTHAAPIPDKSNVVEPTKAIEPKYAGSALDIANDIFFPGWKQMSISAQ